MGQQYLCGVQAMLAEAGFVHLHQSHLADCGGGLQFVYRAGALFPAQALHALGYRAAGDQHHFPSHFLEAGNLFGPVGDGGMIQPGAAVGDQAAADFDDQAFGIREYGFHGLLGCVIAYSTVGSVCSAALSSGLSAGARFCSRYSMMA